ncbi:MAG: type II secretion system protein GspM [Burkholderiaceae bacterium]|jgi:type II secretory pathway component PulM
MTLTDQPWILSIRNRWSRLSARDRAILVVLSMVIAISLVYVLFWMPASAGIEQVTKELSGLRGEHAQMQEMAQEARRLRGASSHDLVLAVPQRSAAVSRTIEQAGLSGPPLPEVVVDEAGAVTARFADVDYAGWISWLGKAEVELGASANKVAVSELPSASGAGHVRAEVTLRWLEKKAPAGGGSH